MRDVGTAFYRRRRVLLAVLLCVAVLLTLCLLVFRTMQSLAPLVGALT